MKKYILIIIVVALSSFKVKAQIGYDYEQWAVGLDLSSTYAFADIVQQHYDYAGSLNLTYYKTPYVPFTLEAQFGTLSGGDRRGIYDVSGREYKNNYKALMFHVDLQAGEIIDYSRSVLMNAIKGFYLGAGVGFIHNDMGFIQRKSPFDPNYIFPGLDRSTNFIVPLRFGYEFKVFNNYNEPQLRIAIGLQQNITFAEDLDGYDDTKAASKRKLVPDMYRQISIGFKYSFGGANSYRKPIAF